MKKILIITFNYAPVLAPRAFRWQAIVEHWVTQGLQADVLCAAQSNAPRTEVIQGVRVHRVKPALFSLVYRKNKLILAAEPASDRDQPAGGGQPLLDRDSSWLLNLAKRVYRSLYWPDHGMFWILPAYHYARRILGAYDGLVTVSWPVNAHFVGGLLSSQLRQRRIPWIMDIGDPFAFNRMTPPNNLNLYRRLNAWAERRLLENAAAAVVPAQATLRAYHGHYPNLADKFHVIPPLAANRVVADDEPRPDPVGTRLVFVGSLRKTNRRPDFLLQFFDYLVENYPGKSFELHFYGDISECLDSFQPYWQRTDQTLFLHGLVSRARAAQAVDGASILINIGNQSQDQLPSKLVDYMASGRPILNIIQNQSDPSVELLKEYPLVFHLYTTASPDSSSDFDLAARFVAAEHKRLSVAQRAALVEGYQPAAIAGKYRDLLDECSNGLL